MTKVNNMNIPLLKAENIRCRVAQMHKNVNGEVVAVSLLLYKDARVDQAILDEVFGAFNWQRSHQLIDGVLYCTVSIRDEKTGGWVAKQDVGTESNTEAEKGQASDSFKRACFNWGIGRELYTAPKIRINAVTDDFYKGKYTQEFKVLSIAYNDSREVKDLAIVDRKGITRWEMKNGKRINLNYPATAPAPDSAPAPAPQPVQAPKPAVILQESRLDEDTYWKAVAGEAGGKTFKRAGKNVTYREYFIEKTNPTPEYLAEFDADVKEVKENSKQ